MLKSKNLFKVLIAEDNRDDCAQLVNSLKEIAECTLAVNGEEALKIHQQWQKKGKAFDFILLDVDMPVINGFDILKEIRSKEEAFPAGRPAGQAGMKPARIIMITTYKDSLMENYNLGWDDFITKPVDAKILIERIQEMGSATKPLSP